MVTTYVEPKQSLCERERENVNTAHTYTHTNDLTLRFKVSSSYQSITKFWSFMIIVGEFNYIVQYFIIFDKIEST